MKNDADNPIQKTIKISPKGCASFTAPLLVGWLVDGDAQTEPSHENYRRPRRKLKFS